MGASKACALEEARDSPRGDEKDARRGVCVLMFVLIVNMIENLRRNQREGAAGYTTNIVGPNTRTTPHSCGAQLIADRQCLGYSPAQARFDAFCSWTLPVPETGGEYVLSSTQKTLYDCSDPY